MHPPQPQRPKWKKWHKIAMAIIGGAFGLILVIVVIAAIATGSGDADQQGDDSGIPAGFDAYLADLDAIDPGIREGRPDDAVFNDANNTCADIAAGEADDVLLDRTVQRYGVNEAEAIVTEDVAQQILDVTREHCGTIRPE
jgi:hypothetical protein